MIALLLSARFGIDVLAPTINRSGPDSTFSSLRAQFQYARASEWRSSQFVFRSAAQFASSSLLALEKFAVGGHTTVRGYRENQLVRDNGFVASVEWQIPLLVDDDGNPTHDVQVTPFIDYGMAWDTGSQQPATKRSSLASVGLGLQWRPTPNWLIRADYGYALDDVTTPTESLQDKGLQFRIEYRMTPRAGS
jgi:hemolysin activation/secretion protein